jgi:predicted RNase H-like HicB family nuclease
MKYSVLYEKIRDKNFPSGYYYAHIPVLDLTTHGLGIEGARVAASDLLKLWVEEKKANGEDVPDEGESLFSTIELDDAFSVREVLSRWDRHSCLSKMTQKGQTSPALRDPALLGIRLMREMSDLPRKKVFQQPASLVRIKFSAIPTADRPTLQCTPAIFPRALSARCSNKRISQKTNLKNSEPQALQVHQGRYIHGGVEITLRKVCEPQIMWMELFEMECL